MFYATHNTHADLRNGNRGCANTWEVSRFETRQQRDAWVESRSNQMARAVKRAEAVTVYAGGFACVGRTVPRGGLFGPAGDGRGGHGDSNFWNEQQIDISDAA